MKNALQERLIQLAEPDYQSFTQKLLPGVENILGVRLPVLRKISKEILKENLKDSIDVYFQEASNETFEEIMIQGMIIGYMKQDLDEILKRIREFLPKINNWSVCDSFCNGLKITETYKEEMWKFIQDYLQDSHEFSVRFAVVMILRFYVTEEYVCSSLDLLDKVQHKGYYVKMAVAWAVSVCFVKFPEITKEYLEENNLDDFTYNKALQKITESLKVDKDTKSIIRKKKR